VLRLWRSAQAKKQRVPAYTIMHDKTLKELSSAKPTELEELYGVNGLGKAKISKYGKSVIEIVKNYINKNKKAK